MDDMDESINGTERHVDGKDPPSDARVHALTNPECLRIADEAGNRSYGCDQEWYDSRWKRQAGCGPNVATNLLVYLGCAGRIRLSFEIGSKAACMHLMEAVWHHVTPTPMGVHTTQHFAKGLLAFSSAHGFPLHLELLEVPRTRARRPSLDAAAAFVADGLDCDAPVAFLNLHNGSLARLESWHWVTVVGLRRTAAGEAILSIFDGDAAFEAELGAWLAGTQMGGGFVRIGPDKAISK